MAQRQVFIVKKWNPYYRMYTLQFDFNSGFQENIAALHDEFSKTAIGRNGAKIAEISSKSSNPEAVKLSPRNLMKYIPSLEKSVPFECAYQASKVFSRGGPFLDLLEVSPKDIKKDKRLDKSGKLIAFEFEGVQYPLEPKTAFYDWLYANACLENPEVSNYILDYDAFTDIAFIPKNGMATQARSCAIYVSLHRLGLIDKIKDFEEFKKLYYNSF